MGSADRCPATSPSGARCTGNAGHSDCHFDAQRGTSWSEPPAAPPCSCDESLALRKRVAELESQLNSQTFVLPSPPLEAPALDTYDADLAAGRMLRAALEKSFDGAERGLRFDLVRLESVEVTGIPGPGERALTVRFSTKWEGT